MNEPTGVDVHLRIADVVRKVQYSTDGTAAALHHLVSAATELVPGAQHADITQVDKHLTLSVASAAGTYGDVLADITVRASSSPCVDVIQGRLAVTSADLELEDRWPAYCDEVCEQTPIRTVLSLPLLNHAYVLGVLNLYADTAGAMDLHARSFAASYASQTAGAWESLRREDQFARALASRDAIGQAKGILMERFEVNAEGAFDILRQISQESNTPLVTVAQNVVLSQSLTPRAGRGPFARSDYIARLRSWRPPAKDGSTEV